MIEIRFLSGADVERLALDPATCLGAVEAALAAQGGARSCSSRASTSCPTPAFDGHFNLLRAYVAPLGVAGVKVVGDYVDN